MTNQACIDLMKKWRFYFDQNIVSMRGIKYDAGNIIMG
jgi:hypothetical protein